MASRLTFQYIVNLVSQAYAIKVYYPNGYEIFVKLFDNGQSLYFSLANSTDQVTFKNQPVDTKDGRIVLNDVEGHVFEIELFKTNPIY